MVEEYDAEVVDWLQVAQGHEKCLQEGRGVGVGVGGSGCDEGRGYGCVGCVLVEVGECAVCSAA